MNEMIEALCIEKNATIQEALKHMDKVGHKLLIVIDDNKFFSLLSIGDIQRAIIKNTDLKDPVSSILRDHVKVADENDNIERIEKEMKLRRNEFMPVLNKDRTISKIIFWEDLFHDKKRSSINQFNLPVVIMAGGLGSRLKPLTYVLPKPLFPVGEKTILEEIFERFGNHGCNHFYISVNYKAELIEYYIRNQKLPYQIDFFKENKPLGTAGSLSLLKGKIDRTFFVSNCDILVDQDYSEILDYHYEKKNEITIVAALKNFSIPYGTIKSGEEGQLIELIEKPDFTFKINSGMYILEKHLLEQIPNNTFYHITQLIKGIKERNGKIGVFPVTEKSWQDIGNIKTLFAKNE
jgi:dTDP-glucose pyrophosphorylase